MNNIPSHTPSDSLGFVHRFLPAAKETRLPCSYCCMAQAVTKKICWTSATIFFRARRCSARAGRFWKMACRVFFGDWPKAFSMRKTSSAGRTNSRILSEPPKLYQFDASRVVAVGYSNGANIAASMLLLRPETLSGAVLFRAMVPLVPEKLPDLSGRPVFLAAGRHDPIIPPENTKQLAAMLQKAGANVSLQWSEGGHQLTAPDVEEAKRWLAKAFASMDLVETRRPLCRGRR